jgi:hypothetical protein
MQSASVLATAVVSVLSLAEDGTSREVSAIGDEGMIGVLIILGSHGVPYKIVVQASGTDSPLPPPGGLRGRHRRRTGRRG